MPVTRSSVRYAQSGDLSVAFQVFGDGPVNIIVVPGFISNLDMMPDTYTFGPLLERLGTIGQCVLFDKRGTGLSDRDLGFGSLEERSDDIRAVMDEVGFESAAIFGYSEGGPLSVVFAATHPERVDALSIYGSYASFPLSHEATLQQLIEDTTEKWGSGHGIANFIQGAPLDSEAAVAALARYERGAATPTKAREIMQAAADADVNELLGSVEARTLVLHSTGDPLIPAEAGKKLAEGIPGAKYSEKDVPYHWPFDGRTLWFTDELIEFFTGERARSPAGNRFLATVVFTDIVSSTEEAARQGDSDWTSLLTQLDQIARDEVTRFDGEFVKTTGDGILAIFNSPSRAVSAAHSIEDEIRALGLMVRAGVHTGEIEKLGDDVGGIGVHIASRVMSLAGDGEVWVSRTVRDLTAGSGLEFNGEGNHVLKGVPGKWELYSSPNPR